MRIILCFSFLFLSKVILQSPVLLVLNNMSGQTIYYSFKTLRDSLPAGKKMVIDLSPEKIPGYFFVYSRDASFKGGMKQKNFWLFADDVKRREIDVTPSAINFWSAKSEMLLEKYIVHNPRRDHIFIDSLLRANQNNEAGAGIIRYYFLDERIPVDSIRLLYSRLSFTVKQGKGGKAIRDYIASRENTQEGKKVNDFALADTSGSLIHLNHIKANYILLDFWFSTCGPCLASFPSLKVIYNKMPRNKFEILGISVDGLNEKEMWKTTIIKQQLPWLNLHDPVFKIANGVFAIPIYPTRVLLNEKKIIIKLNPTDDEIEQIINKGDGILSN
ncbi:MAG: AhpC/TSA family protein [Chitinophagaceae bacterium]|nr:AhpC/TSA family protein [Chitinophagaceae bacterium]